MKTSNISLKSIAVALHPFMSPGNFPVILEGLGFSVVGPYADHHVCIVPVDEFMLPLAVRWMGQRTCVSPCGRPASSVPSLVMCTDLNVAKQMLAAGADDFVIIGTDSAEISLRIQTLAESMSALRSTKIRENERKSLLALTAQYASALDVTQVMKDMTLQLADHLGVDRVALILTDGVGETGHVVASSDNLEIADLKIDLCRYPEIQEALRRLKPVVIDDVKAHPLLDAVRNKVAEAGVSAIAAIPLEVLGQVFGVMLIRTAEGPFCVDDVEFARSLAGATAVAVRNAKLVEKLEGEANLARHQVDQMAPYKEFFRFSADGMVQLDKKGIVVAMNDAGLAILGKSRDEVIGQSVTRLVTPRCKQDSDKIFRWTQRNEHTCGNIDVEVVGRGGKSRTLWVCWAVVREGLAFASFRDITEAKGSAQSLRRSSEFMEKLIDTTEISIVALGTGGDVILFNKSASQVLGDGMSLIDRRLENLFCDEFVTKIRALIALNPKQDDESGILRIHRTYALDSLGNGIPVQLTATLVHEGDAVLAAVVVFRDLREQSRLEEELKQAEAQLVDAQRHAVAVELAGAAAHQLNQPLTCIVGYTDLLMRKVPSADPNRIFIDRIYSEGRRMAELVRKLGRITIYATRQYVGERRIIDLDRAVGEEDVESAAEEGGEKSDGCVQQKSADELLQK